MTAEGIIRKIQKMEEYHRKLAEALAQQGFHAIAEMQRIRAEECRLILEEIGEKAQG